MYTRSDCVSASRPGIPSQKHYQTRGPVGFHEGSVEAQHETRVYALRIDFRDMPCYASQIGARIHAFRAVPLLNPYEIQRDPVFYSVSVQGFPGATQKCIRSVYTRVSRSGILTAPQGSTKRVYTRVSWSRPRGVPRDSRSERVYTRFVGVGKPYVQCDHEMRVSPCFPRLRNTGIVGAAPCSPRKTLVYTFRMHSSIFSIHPGNTC